MCVSRHTSFLVFFFVVLPRPAYMDEYEKLEGELQKQYEVCLVC